MVNTVRRHLKYRPPCCIRGTILVVMPVVKGGVWTNIEDEILKASVSKYGLNQWARVSSLLARKTPKQCKARWTEWLDPAIRKIEWSKEEDEKLLHLAKLMPTQWRTIAPIVGRTANQCLDRYSRLLDEAEARENDELGLAGPQTGETAAPTGDDVRKLRPGELDTDPESRPAKPDTIDMDEDEKEMLSEARARLANTQGKKAKRKARERQLEESRRLAVLQKRRELKNAGINIKIVNRKKGQMDYNADIPFEKAPAAGFYDTLEEDAENEKEKEAFDPRKQQLARKRQGDPEDGQDNKRQKQSKNDTEAAKAAARAAQLQRLREQEQQSKRRALNLPAPQVSESELEDIVKMGMSGQRATQLAGEDSDQGLVAQYSSAVGATPIRTPRAPATEDRIANEIRNIQALQNTQSSLLGGENTPLHVGTGSTGFAGATPRPSSLVTPNPIKTPALAGRSVAMTPMRTPARDSYSLNASISDSKSLLRAKLASLPRPKAIEFELELPEEHVDSTKLETDQPEDQEDVDRRRQEAEEAEALARFKRQTQVVQRALPKPKHIDYSSILQSAKAIRDPIRALIAQEAALLMAHDSAATTASASRNRFEIEEIADDYLARARSLIREESSSPASQDLKTRLEAYYASLPTPILPHPLDITDSIPALSAAYTTATSTLISLAQSNNTREIRLKKFLGGYVARHKMLKKKLETACTQLSEDRCRLRAYEDLRVAEEAGLKVRLERAREEVGFVTRREREVQEEFRLIRDELEVIRNEASSRVNGH